MVPDLRHTNSPFMWTRRTGYKEREMMVSVTHDHSKLMWLLLVLTFLMLEDVVGEVRLVIAHQLRLTPLFHPIW